MVDLSMLWHRYFKVWLTVYLTGLTVNNDGDH